ncbi:MAG: PRC-barrel domain-containing protein [Chloroflexota bacterium]|nr:PRC-barrel domain-containing protein [Chloroflexota bacterium]
MKLDIGTPVRYPDGEQVGTIHKVVFASETATVHEIVVETPDFVGRLVLVPVDRLREDGGDVLTLVADREAVAAMSDYIVERYMDPPDDWTMPENYVPGDGLFSATMYYPTVPVFEESNTDEGSVEWGEGTAVLCSDGPFGTVDEVLIDATGNVTGLVVRSDDDPAVRLLITPDLIGSADSQTIELTCSLSFLPAQASPYSDPTGEPETESLVPGD